MELFLNSPTFSLGVGAVLEFELGASSFYTGALPPGN
jgi:hypothetical protein